MSVNECLELRRFAARRIGAGEISRIGVRERAKYMHALTGNLVPRSGGACRLIADATVIALKDYLRIGHASGGAYRDDGSAVAHFPDKGVCVGLRHAHARKRAFECGPGISVFIVVGIGSEVSFAGAEVNAGAVDDPFVAATILFRIAAEDMFQLFPPAVFVAGFVETSGSRERVRAGVGASYLRLAMVGN